MNIYHKCKRGSDANNYEINESGYLLELRMGKRNGIEVCVEDSIYNK